MSAREYHKRRNNHHFAILVRRDVLCLLTAATDVRGACFATALALDASGVRGLEYRKDFLKALKELPWFNAFVLHWRARHVI